MSARTVPAVGPGYDQLCSCTAKAATASAFGPGAFPFMGTAGDNLARVERAIDRQRKAHGPLRDLLKRQRILKARCAALGVQHG